MCSTYSTYHKTSKTPHMYYSCGTTGHVLQVWHNWPCITSVAQLAMYYRCDKTVHVLQVWHNWPCITGMAQLAMYYRCNTTGHVLQVWHNWPCITGVAQLAMYYRCGTIDHVWVSTGTGTRLALWQLILYHWSQSDMDNSYLSSGNTITT